MVREICIEALEVRLQLQEISDRWPEDANTHGFLRKIHADVEDAVEHTPGYFFKKGVNRDAWVHSDMYLTLLLDVALLEMDSDFERLDVCRERLLKSKHLAPGNVRERVRECLS